MPHCCLRRGDEDKPEADAGVETTNQKMPHSSSGDDDEKTTIITMFKYFYSTILLIFSVVIVISLIFTEQTQLAQVGHPIVAFVLIWFLLIWLGTMEGGQASLVGLRSVNRDLYKESHPIAFKSTYIAHRGDNMEKFIIGRQFLVVLVVFLTNLSGAALPGSHVLGLPDTINSIFVGSGLAMVLTTVIIGQLTAQVNATSYMLDIINNYFMLYFVTYISMAIEFSGLLHSVYLVQMFFSKLTGKSIDTNKGPRSQLQILFFWGRILFSCVILGFAFAVVLSALFTSKTTMWQGVPPAVSVIVFFLLMILAGLMEGMQIAILAVLKIPEEEINQHPRAKANRDLTLRGNNLKAFLIGRQICVTACMFVVARIITLNVRPGQDENIFGFSDLVQEKFLNTNILGAIITTIASSLAWRVVASSFPLPFLSNPLVYVIIQLCLLIEASGLCSAAWILAMIQKRVARFESDEIRIGTVEEEDAENTVIDLEVQMTIESKESFESFDTISQDDEVASC